MAEDNAEYSKVDYWNKRYEAEPSYDWFQSVYSHCLEDVVKCVQEVATNTSATSTPSRHLRVLHLGCGNSCLCGDLCKAFPAATPTSTGSSSTTITLYQLNIDYSPVVIDNMKKGVTSILPVADARNTEWLVGDIRDFTSFLKPAGEEEKKVEGDENKQSSTPPKILFDLIIDKGTMDALQTDKENPDLEEEIHSMLSNVDRYLSPGGMFIQYSWEIPHYRKYFTIREEAPLYSWQDSWSSKKLGGSDMYYSYHYCKPLAAGGSSPSPSS